MTETKIRDIERAIINGASFVIDKSFTFLFKNENWRGSIAQINITPQEGILLSPGVEIIFKDNVPVPQLVVPMDCIKQSSSNIANIGNLFELGVTSLSWNRLLGMHGFNKIGIDVIDANGSLLNIVRDDTDVTDPFMENDQFKAGSRIAIPIGFVVRGIRLFFIKNTGSDNIFQKASFIFRILGSIIPEYFDLVQKKYEFEQLSFSFLTQGRTMDVLVPDYFELFSFIDYYDNIETRELDGPSALIERKLFVQRVLRMDYYRISNVDGFRDMKLDYEILKRIDTVFLAGNKNSYNHLTTNIDHLILQFRELVDASPEKCFIAELTDIPESYIAVFDSDLYQFDMIDLIADEAVKFSSLADPIFSQRCKAIINGPYWDLAREKESRLTGVAKENLFGALNVMSTIKSIPKGNTRFRNGNRWEPDQFVEYHHDTVIRVNKADATRYFFYQTVSGILKFGKGLLPAAHEANPSDAIAVGCDYLVGFVNKEQFNNDKLILDGDTDDWIYPENQADFNNNFEIHSANPNYQYPGDDELGSESKGFPFFGTIVKGGKKYLYFFVGVDAHPYTPGFAIDEEYKLRPRLAIDFLKQLGADNVFFTDGGTSAAFIYDNVNVIKNSRFIKDPLIAAAIGIQPKNNFSNLIITGAKVKLGGSKAILEPLIQNAIIPQNGKDELFTALKSQISLPFIDHAEFPQHINSKFGFRTINGNLGFHEGVDIRAQSPLNVKINIRGKVFLTGGVGEGFGNYIIVNHGRDRYRNYYFTLYAHLSAINVSVNQVVEKDAVIGVTGETEAPGQPHLHYELIKVNKNFSAITYTDLCRREHHLDPEDFVLPANLIID